MSTSNTQHATLHAMHASKALSFRSTQPRHSTDLNELRANATSLIHKEMCIAPADKGVVHASLVGCDTFEAVTEATLRLRYKQITARQQLLYVSDLVDAEWTVAVDNLFDQNMALFKRFNADTRLTSDIFVCEYNKSFKREFCERAENAVDTWQSKTQEHRNLITTLNALAMKVHWMRRGGASRGTFNCVGAPENLHNLIRRECLNIGACAAVLKYDTDLCKLVYLLNRIRDEEDLIDFLRYITNDIRHVVRMHPLWSLSIEQRASDRNADFDEQKRLCAITPRQAPTKVALKMKLTVPLHQFD